MVRREKSFDMNKKVTLVDLYTGYMENTVPTSRRKWAIGPQKPGIINKKDNRRRLK